MEKIIKDLIKIGKSHISDAFSLNLKEAFIYSISGSYISKARNIKKNETESVNVLNWFNDFWLYIEIRYVPQKKKKDIPNIFFSLSIFQGSHDDEIKNQLFRAEWDNYEGESYNHPQPHWHIYTEYDRKQMTKTFEEEIEEVENAFLDFVKGKKEIVALNRFHFAMNGQWAEKKSTIHKIHDSNSLSDWFSGLLIHIKQELEYLINK